MLCLCSDLVILDTIIDLFTYLQHRIDCMQFVYIIMGVNAITKFSNHWDVVSRTESNAAR